MGYLLKLEYLGASLLSNYDLCIQNNIKIIGIDPFEKIEIFNGKTTNNTNKQVIEDAREGALKRKNHLINIIKHNKLNTQLLNENSYDVAEHFKPNSIDLLHIDGVTIAMMVLKRFKLLLE